MSERTIFPDLKLFKKTVTEHFLLSLQEIYRIHPVYPYTDDESPYTSIHISPTYANITYDSLRPQLLVKVGQYDMALQDTLGNNLYEEIRNDDDVIGGYRSLKNLSTMVTVMVRAFAEEESSDIADELAVLGVYAAHHMFAQMGLNIRGSSVSETVKVDNQNDYFQTNVNFQVDVPWQFTTVNRSGATNPDWETTIPEDFIGVYRMPGVYVHPKKLVK
jgi:hypothetical protein